MSVSKLKRTRTKAEKPGATRDSGAGTYLLPPTVSRSELLDGGSDRRFRALVGDLLTLADRMELVREHHGKRLGISGPQYSVLVAIAHLQGKHGVSVSALAQSLHVSSAFVASETGKLARRNLLLKRVNPLDRRGVLLSVSPAGRLKLDRMAAEIRAVNDLFFGSLDGEAFIALSKAAAGLVESSSKAARYIGSMKGVPQSAMSRAG